MSLRWLSLYRIMGSASAWPAVAVPTPLSMLRRITSGLSVTDGTAITYNSEYYDPQNVCNGTTTVTLPSTGLYRFSVGSDTSTNTTGAAVLVDAAGAIGRYQSLCGSTAPRWQSGHSAIMALTANQAITNVASGGTTTHNANYSFFGCEKLDSNTRYCVLRKSSDQTSFTSGKVTFGTVAGQQGGNWGDVVNSRISVPSGSGISRVRVSANYAISSATTAIAEITKNGSTDVRGCPSHRRAGAVIQNLSGPPILVNTGDYFELQLTLGASRTVSNGDATWLCVDEVPSATKSVLAYNSSGQTITTSDAALTYDSNDHDTDGMHSTSSNTDRLTVPAGASYAKLYFYVKGELNDTARVQCQIERTLGGTTTPATDSDVGAASVHQRLSGCSGWMQVSPGDYFRLICSCSTGTVVTTGGYFAMECI